MLSIRHRLRIHETTRKPFFEITFLVLARIPLKMWKVLTFFSMSLWSWSTPLRSFIFQVWDVMMSHMWIWVQDQAAIVTYQRSRLFFFSLFHVFTYYLTRFGRFARFSGFVLVVSFHSFRWFHFGCFVSLFRVLVHADTVLSSLTHWAWGSRKRIQSCALTLKLFLTHWRFLAVLVKYIYN